jgi:hypothetical protein
MDILISGLDVKGSGVEFGPYLLQSSDKLPFLVRTDETGCREGTCIRDTTLNISFIESVVKEQRVVELAH